MYMHVNMDRLEAEEFINRGEETGVLPPDSADG